MTSRLSVWRKALQQKPTRSGKTRNASSIALFRETPIEEETLPYYKPEHYYPVRIGDVYGIRYQVAGKIGYGTYSTSWLCRDLQCVLLIINHIELSI